MIQDNTKVGPCKYVAGGTILKNYGLIPDSTARQVITTTGASAVPVYMAGNNALITEDVECIPIEPGREVIGVASAAIAAGALVEFIVTSTGAGKVRTLASGTARFYAVTAAAADGDYIVLRPI